MTNKKEEKDMHAATVTEDTGFIDMREQLAPKAVKAYVEARVAMGAAEYNHGTIHVRSKHPMDECLRRGIIEDQHHESAKRIITIRDCAFARSAGRIYNDLGEGDSGIDAMTLYTVTYRLMKRPVPIKNVASPWHWIEIVCFTQPDIDGTYFNEMDYRAIYPFAPNIQSSFEVLDKAIAEARKEIKEKIRKAEELATQ